MRYLLPAIFVFGLMGCPNQETVNDTGFSCPESEEIDIFLKPMCPEDRKDSVESVKVVSNRSERINKLKTIARMIGIGTIIIGALLVLPTIASWFGWTIPIYGQIIGGLSMLVGFGMRLFGSKVSDYGKNALPRYGWWLILGGGLILASSFYMRELYFFGKWTLIAAGILTGLVATWEIAHLYYEHFKRTK